jgi:hypothetical protein
LTFLNKQYCVGTLSFATVLPKLGRLDQNKFNNYALIDFWNNNKAMQPPSISPENIFLG